jgi:hypothetical protein
VQPKKKENRKNPVKQMVPAGVYAAALSAVIRLQGKERLMFQWPVPFGGQPLFLENGLWEGCCPQHPREPCDDAIEKGA